MDSGGDEIPVRRSARIVVPDERGDEKVVLIDERAGARIEPPGAGRKHGLIVPVVALANEQARHVFDRVLRVLQVDGLLDLLGRGAERLLRQLEFLDDGRRRQPFLHGCRNLRLTGLRRRCTGGCSAFCIRLGCCLLSCGLLWRRADHDGRQVALASRSRLTRRRGRRGLGDLLLRRLCRYLRHCGARCRCNDGNARWSHCRKGDGPPEWRDTRLHDCAPSDGRVGAPRKVAQRPMTQVRTANAASREIRADNGQTTAGGPRLRSSKTMFSPSSTCARGNGSMAATRTTRPDCADTKIAT